ncbi:DUF169 domain-containing protein [Thermodesulfobacteriota bacterium]
MDLDLRDKFISLWKTYFNGAELPLTFYYTNRKPSFGVVDPPAAHQCMIGILAKARKGDPICFDVDSIGCGGGKRYLGFTKDIMPDFEYFLSCGIPGKLEGERYKKTPEMVKEMMQLTPDFRAPGPFIVFKRWDMLDADDDPAVAIIYAEPDVLSGLFTLASYDEVEPEGVIAPFSAGCGSIVKYPYLEIESDRPKGIIGMFDVSARPYVPKGTLSFAVPMKKFQRMIENMQESFLITPSWEKVQKRIKK